MVERGRWQAQCRRPGPVWVTRKIGRHRSPCCGFVAFVVHPPSTTPRASPRSRGARRGGTAIKTAQRPPTAVRAAYRKSRGQREPPFLFVTAEPCPKRSLELWNVLRSLGSAHVRGAGDREYVLAHCALRARAVPPLSLNQGQSPGGARAGTRTGKPGSSGLGQNPEPGCPGGGTVFLMHILITKRTPAARSALAV